MPRPATFTKVDTTTSTSSANTTTPATITLPTGTSAFYISCTTTAGKIALDGSDMTGAGFGHVIPKDLPPQLILIGNGGTRALQWLSTSSTAAVAIVTPLRD